MDEVADLLEKLFGVIAVAIISGGDFLQYQKQVIGGHSQGTKSIFAGGNDYAALGAGIEAIPPRFPDDTKRVIQPIVACESW